MPISLRHLRRFFMPRPASGNASRLLLAFPFTRRRFVLAPRSRFLQGNLQLLDRRLREDCPVVTQQMIGMNFAAAHQLDAFEVARTELEIAVAVLCYLDQQDGLID